VSFPLNLLEFPDRPAASEAAAGLVEEALRACLVQQTFCSLVVSGGSTPEPCFELLSRKTLDWDRVTVTPSDERWVPASHPDSNERLVREHLLIRQAANGRFLPLFRENLAPGDAVEAVGKDLKALVRPFACTLLGMGEDGHFASLFPDFDGLETALEPDQPRACVAVKTAGSPHLRMSLSLATLLDSRTTILLIFGAAKRRVLEAAAEGESAYPVSRLIQHQTRPLTVVWAP
jgi:6-phosphogluconolactonase